MTKETKNCLMVSLCVLAEISLFMTINFGVPSVIVAVVLSGFAAYIALKR